MKSSRPIYKYISKFNNKSKYESLENSIPKTKKINTMKDKDGYYNDEFMIDFVVEELLRMKQSNPEKFKNPLKKSKINDTINRTKYNTSVKNKFNIDMNNYINNSIYNNNEFSYKKTNLRQQWNNSIYNYNTNNIINLAQKDKSLNNLITSYFNLFNQQLEKKANIKYYLPKYRKNYPSKIYANISNIKHTNDNITLNIFTYNRYNKYITNKLEKLDLLYTSRYNEKIQKNKVHKLKFLKNKKFKKQKLSKLIIRNKNLLILNKEKSVKLKNIRKIKIGIRKIKAIRKNLMYLHNLKHNLNYTHTKSTYDLLNRKTIYNKYKTLLKKTYLKKALSNIKLIKTWFFNNKIYLSEESDNTLHNLLTNNKFKYLKFPKIYKINKLDKNVKNMCLLIRKSKKNKSKFKLDYIGYLNTNKLSKWNTKKQNIKRIEDIASKKINVLKKNSNLKNSWEQFGFDFQVVQILSEKYDKLKQLENKQTKTNIKGKKRNWKKRNWTWKKVNINSKKRLNHKRKNEILFTIKYLFKLSNWKKWRKLKILRLWKAKKKFWWQKKQEQKQKINQLFIFRKNTKKNLSLRRKKLNQRIYEWNMKEKFQELNEDLNYLKTQEINYISDDVYKSFSNVQSTQTEIVNVIKQCLYQNTKNQVMKDSLYESQLNLIMYYRQILLLNKFKYQSIFLFKLKDIIAKLYNKKINFNIIDLKYSSLDSNIFTQVISLKAKARKFSIRNILNKSLRKIRIKKPKDMNFKHISVKVKNTNNVYLQNIMKTNKGVNILTSENDVLNYSINKLYSNKTNNFDKIFLSLNNKYIKGIKIEAKGRLTKRLVASRSVFKYAQKGSLRNFKSSYNRLYGYLIRNHIDSNIQYTKLESKNRNGSFGIKGWISTS